MKTFQPADHLHSRTFLGLLVAQFLAAFNDQAIHAAAMFFAMNTGTMAESTAITLMPVLFYAPWALFCTIAGYFADRYSKRVSLVLWKVVEVGITLLALFGFWLGRQGGQPLLGSWVVLSTVFLMGMHSAFFVPAKYGTMPEILTPRMLSKGNGILESLSFLAVILGTVSGGVMSSSSVFGGNEYIIGLILVGLAVVGVAASLFIEKMPAGNPHRTFPSMVYKPLLENIRLLWTIKPLRFALVGIAFFTFLVSYMRAVVYMHGQSQLPPWDEAQTSYIVGMVALGIGLGSPLVGYLSGGKVEVGLVPIGALGMILATTLGALFLSNVAVLVSCIVFMGFFTGFYLVPLFSLLQHRAPKESKGDSIATSNFINITGAIGSALLFWVVGQAAVSTGFTPALPEDESARVTGVLEADPEYVHGDPHRVQVGGKEFVADETGPDYVLLKVDQQLEKGSEVDVRAYRATKETPKGTERVTYFRVQKAGSPPRPVHDRHSLPALLFLGAGAMTLFTLVLLWLLLPDLFRRTRLWLRGLRGYKMELAGMLQLPGSGPVVVATNAATAEAISHVERAVDRGMDTFPEDCIASEAAAIGRTIRQRVSVVCVSIGADGVPEGTLAILLAASSAPVLPVVHSESTRDGVRRVYVAAGRLLEPNSPLAAISGELKRVGEDLAHRVQLGGPLERQEGEH